MSKRIEQGADLFKLTSPLGFQQDAQNTQGTESEASRYAAALLFIEQDNLGLQLDRQCKGLRFAAVEITSQDHDQILVTHLMALDP